MSERRLPFDPKFGQPACAYKAGLREIDAGQPKAAEVCVTNGEQARLLGRVGLEFIDLTACVFV